MPRRCRIQREVVERLLEFYRTRPGSVNAAAKHAGCCQRTAWKAWEFGWGPEVPYAIRPMKDIIAEEQEYARARMMELELEAKRLQAGEDARKKSEIRDKALRDATEIRTHEAQMIRVGRSAATGLLVTLANLSKGAAEIGDKVRGALEGFARKPDLTPLDAAHLTRVVSGLTGALKQASDAAQRCMEMERLLLGQPQSIVGVSHAVEGMTLDDAQARIEAAQRALERAQQRAAMPAAPLSLTAGTVIDATLPPSQKSN